jgi:cardiolipin synthase
MIRHIPNTLSAARILAAPYVCWLLWQHDYGAALVWMAAIGATDWFDGFLARRFKAQSKVGAMLDPIADKVLLAGAFLTLALTGAIPAWLAWLVLGRDAVILAFAIIVLTFTKTRREFPPSLAGKMSTGGQILYVLAVTAAGAGYIPAAVHQYGQWAMTTVTAWSSVDYGLRAARQS